jgi:polysaccharide chain length determinant protein (PEP-CTERM system associated)
MLGQRELNMDDYWAILRRRRWLILLPAILGPAIAFGISFLFSSQYTSTTLILIEGQRVPDAFVKSVVSDDLSTRVGTMQQQILSRTRLQPIIEKFGLYRKETADQMPVEDIVGLMRKAIQVTPVTSALITKQGNIPGFYIAFTGDSARVAQQVCVEITSMFISENSRQRAENAQGTTNFLEGEVEEAKRKLDEQDDKLAKFKRKYMGLLPEDAQANLQLLNALNTQYQAVTQTVSRSQQDKTYNESLLAQQVAAWDTLRAGNNPHPETVEQTLATMQSKLGAMETQYTPDHPDIIRLKAEIEQLKKKAQQSASAAPDQAAEKTAHSSLPEPSAIQQLRSQGRAIDEAIRNGIREQNRLKEQIKVYQSRLQSSPAVEQEYKQITRDHLTALEFYNDLLKKRDQSQMATTLERRQEGEQFRIMDSANLPEKPSFPDRSLFAGIGLGGGLALGLGVTLLLEMRDKSLRTERDIEFFLGVPTLALVPELGEKEKGKRGLTRRGKNAADLPSAA